VSDKSILLVEDNPDDRALTIHALETNKIGNRLVIARDGVEALDYLFCTGPHVGRVRDDLPSVVLLDLKLPRIDGIEVLRRIRSDPHTCLLPVVILTSSNEEEDRVKGYTCGANSYVRKPVDFDDFVRATAQLGLYWLLLNEAPPPPHGTCP
jgi:two-component system response regulator